MGEVLSILTVNGLCDLICEQDQQRDLKFTIVATHTHTGKYLWDEYDTTADITSDDNNTILVTENDQY